MSLASYRVRSIARRGCLEAMRVSSPVMAGVNLGEGRGGRLEGDGESEDCCSWAIRDSAAARSAGVGSGSTSSW